jgi:hypothetical protein
MAVILASGRAGLSPTSGVVHILKEGTPKFEGIGIAYPVCRKGGYGAYNGVKTQRLYPNSEWREIPGVRPCFFCRHILFKGMEERNFSWLQDSVEIS